MVLKKFAFLLLLLVSNYSFSQCFQIESILVDACDSGSSSADEGFNEMFRIKIGATALNTSNLNVNWPSNTWQGLIQNATTNTKVAQLNADIIAAGGCGTILEPTGGVLPANATVIIVSSQNFNITLNSFGALTSNTYILFQDNTSVTTGHFGNYNATPGTRTLTVSFGGSCSDTVTYQRASLVNIFGVSGGTTAENNGATVNFSPSGTPNYVNNGCTAPIPPFTVEAGTTPVSACAGQTINLLGTAQGQTSVSWSAPSGTFSNSNNLNTSYTIPTTAISGSTITLTLTATNICGFSITDNITINISGSTLNLTSATGTNIQSICTGNAITPIEYTFGGGATSINITGLPVGITAITSGNIVTISGTPTSNFNYIINTIGGCGTVNHSGSVTVNPNASLNLYCDIANSTSTSLAFDFSNVGQTSFSYSYTIDGGSPITGTHISPSNFTVSGLTPGQSVVFTLSANGVSCVATQTVSCTTSCPTATLITTSGIGTDNQTICAGNAIIPIQYTFGNGATSATVTGLPTGITSSISGNVITISGNPSSTFSYTISTVGGCGTATLNGNVTISTNSSLNLTSASGTDNQTICAGNAIIPIQYTFGNGATSATVTGLPTGVTSSISGNVITISGNPSSTFSYTISTVGGCGTATLNGNVTISTNSSLNLTSASGTDNQTICAGNAIIPIQYTFGNGATSATVTGLPTGVTSSISGNVITISGNPSSTFSYTISTVGGCGTATLNGNVTISTNSSLNLTSASGTDNQTICAGNAIIPIQYTFGNGATSATVTGLPTGVTSSISGNVITISGNPSSTFSYTISTVGGCGTATLNGNVTISTNSSLNLTSAAGTDNQTICAGNAIIPIQYTFGNGATSATVTGLPTGVTSSISGNVITISGNPSSTFSYTISTVGGCGTATLNGTISTTIGITPIFIQEPPLCSGNIANIPTTSTNGIIGIWQIISSTLNSVIYEFTPNPGQCATTTTMTIIVYPRPEVTITSASTSYCDGSVTNITLSSTIPGTTYTWNALSSNLDTTLVFSGSGSTISQTLDLVNNLNVGFVTYSVTPFANGCSGTPQQITIYANPIPEMTASPTLSEICSGDTAHIDFTSNISGVSYSWTFSATGVTGASNGSGTSIDQVLTSSDATTGGFVIYTITPELNGCLGTSVTVQVDVKPRPEFFGTIPTTILCSGETTNIGLSASITGTNFEWTVVSSNVTGASDGSGIAIVQTLEAPSVTGTAVYTVVPVLNGCYGSPITVTVTVNPLPKPVLEDGTLCIIQATGEVYQTYTLNTGLSATGYSFDWYFNGGLIAGANAPTYTADEVGLYSVIVTNTTTTCESEEVFATVDFVNPATSFSTVVTEAFTNNATITVSVPDGTGTLLYQLDEGAYQESNVFTGVSAGEHTVTVIDTEGCTFMIQTVLVIDYPKYFTPNGDGHNDTWNIIGMNQADAKLYIFDRYGKLIKQISPSSGSDGWDGTYNGQQLPSTDYWFSLDYTENGAAKQFKAHFSMKR